MWVFFVFCSQNESLKAAKHTHITLGADCQLDPLQPNHQHNAYEQSRPQTHHGHHHNFNHSSSSSSKVDAKGQIIAANLNEPCCGDGLPLRSSSPNHSRLSPQHLVDPPETTDDTDPDVIPNQYGKNMDKEEEEEHHDILTTTFFMDGISTNGQEISI